MNSLLYKRIRAFGIDTSGCFFLMMLLILGFPDLNKNIRMGLAILLMVIFYLFPYLFNTGQTFGKRSQKIKVVKKDGSKASIFRIIGRDTLKVVLFFITGGIYGLFSLFILDESGKGPTLHDFIFKTKVLDLDYNINKNTSDYIPNSLRKKGIK